MKPLPESEPSFSPGERSICSIRAVIARACDVLWRADPCGTVTSVIVCRPARSEVQGRLDDTEVAQVDALWGKALRCAERFSAVYHVRAAGGSALRNFLVQAVPVFDNRDEVLYWSGHATEVERFADAGTRFISEATAALSSSLSRATIVNRFIKAATAEFADGCAIFTFDDAGGLQLEGFADGRSTGPMRAESLTAAVEAALRSKQPQLMLSATTPAPPENVRSLLAVPLLAGMSCAGAAVFFESERRSSFAAREQDVGVVVSRQLAMALENIKTFERERHVTERLRFLARITDRLFATLDAAETLSLLLDEIVERFADYAIAAEMSGEHLRILARSGTAATLHEESEREFVEHLAARRSLRNATLLKPGPLRETIRPLSWMMVPLYSGDAVYGAIVACSNSRRYGTEDLELLEEVGRRASIALDRAENVARERRLIRTLQHATLPPLLAKVEGATLSAIYRPASSEVQVGGDWYDAYDLDEHRVLFSVGDVTGHGLEASAVMGKLRHSINVVAMYEPNPARILDAAERILLRRFPAAVATAFVAVFDARTLTIAYANAGHPYPLLRRRDGTIQELEADGLPLGLRSAGEPANPVNERLDEPALLTFYSDGLTEATHDTLLGERLLHEAVGSRAILYVENPARFIEEYCLRGQSPDDVAILAVNFVKCRRWRFESRDWNAAKLARREFAAELGAAGMPERSVKNGELIFGELSASIAQHSEGPVEFALEWCAGAPVLHVVARGDEYARREYDHDLWLVGRLGARVDVETLPGFGAHVTAAMSVSP
ncbi:MAG TPA: SpoIIE family protein phosphatase [Candidatus Cybelea sp.]